MGDVADMMLEGILCESCGEFIDGPAPGHARNCGCMSPRTVRSVKRVVGRQIEADRHNRERHEAAKARKPFKCECGKLCRTAEGLVAHRYAKHGSGGW